MDKETRKELEKIHQRLEEIAGYEREKAENMDEYLSVKVERMEEIADYLEEAVRNISDAIER